LVGHAYAAGVVDGQAQDADQEPTGKNQGAEDKAEDHGDADRSSYDDQPGALRVRSDDTEPVHPARALASQERLRLRDALRAAAIANTYQSALDVTGAALLAISALVRAEVRNG